MRIDVDAMTTNADVDAVITILKEGNHTHQPNFAEEEVRAAAARVKRRTEAHSNEPLQSRVIEELADVHNKEVLTLLPERMALVSMINREQ